MTNEWQEYLDYTTFPEYSATNKQKFTYIGRFTFDAIVTFKGHKRILTILARRYLFHGKDGEILKENPYDRIEYARKALCAWCSIPDKENGDNSKIDFSGYHEEFPELVNENGEGWYYKHIQNIIRFVKEHPDKTSIKAQEKCEILKKRFKENWANKVKQFQVPLYASNTKGAWVIKFDDILADALECGPLRTEEYELPKNVITYLQNDNSSPVEWTISAEIIRFYYANHKDAEGFVVLPVTNFECYFRSAAFGSSRIHQLSKEIFERKSSYATCRIKVNPVWEK